MRSLAWLAVLLPAAAAAAPAPPLDPGIAAIAGDISVDRIQRTIYVLASFKTRNTLSDPQPSGDGIGAALAWLQTHLARIAQDSGGRLEVETDSYTQPAAPPLLPRAVDVSDLVATLPGTGGAAAPVYVAAASYDSRGRDPRDATGPAPGADADGSGVAAVLELARVMAPRDFRATLVFLFSAGGMQDGEGAAHWAAEEKRSGVPVAGVVELGAIGNSRGADGKVDRSAVRLFAPGVPPGAAAGDALRRLIAAGGENDTPPRELARALRREAARYGAPVGLRIVYRADRRPAGDGPRPFVGLPCFGAVRFAETEDRPGPPEEDAADGVDFDYAAAVARTVAVALADLARAPAPPAGVSVAPGPEGGAALRWTAPEDAARCRVVWRDTTAPYWQHDYLAPPGASAADIRGVSPENAIFGVEAIDAAGHVSPAAYALPEPTPFPP